MKNGELIDILSKFNPDAEVVIFREVANYGYGKVLRIVPGIYEKTDYGNDFYPDQRLILSGSQIRSICLFPEDDDILEKNIQESVKIEH